MKPRRRSSRTPTDLKGRRRTGKGRTDYLLCVQVPGLPQPLPVAVLEAKAEGADPLKGMQQAKGYYDASAARHAVRYVFSTNGHRYAEFDRGTQMPGNLRPLADFPTHAELTARYARDTGIDLATPTAQLLFQADSTAFGVPRHYQDAAIRAALEKVLHCEQAGEPPRVLLSLATGAGKTVIATNLLWRLHEAGRLSRPALFLCDRDELREQALDKLGRAFPKGSGRAVRTEQGRNAAHNARVHVTTYQTLGLDGAAGADGTPGADSFLSRHYGDDAFSVIVIDECHRSAWGRWSEVLRRNPNAIQIGLTATPRQLHPVRRSSTPAVDTALQAAAAEDATITANNRAYFGPPAYEYTLIQAQEDGYLAACEIVRLQPSIDGLTFDLKAVNPRARVVRDNRTPAEVLDAITAHGLQVDAALNRLRALTARQPAPLTPI